MSDVFISYKREERPTALKLATALERVGWSVWWDLELVGGERFDDAIEAELDKAGASLCCGRSFQCGRTL